MVRKPFAALGVIFLLGLGLGLIVNFQHGTRPAPTKRAAEKAQPDVTADNLELVQGSEGKELWRVRAKSAQYSVDKRIAIVQQPRLLAYVGPKRQKAYVRAESGEINQAGNSFTLRDKIKGRLGQLSLSSDVFDYLGAMRKAYFRGRVMVARPDFQANATTVEVDLDTRELTAAGGVSAEFAPAAFNPANKGKRP